MGKNAESFSTRSRLSPAAKHFRGISKAEEGSPDGAFHVFVNLKSPTS
jgi:hypothetical protein